MGMMSEFKAFAMRGNVVDLAVGVVIGAAFGKIVSALVDGLLMPPLGLLLGGVDFSDLAITLKAATENSEAVLFKYGAFLQTVVDFMIIAFAIFVVVKLMNSLQRKQEEAPPKPAETPEDVQLLREIRDLLKQRG